MRNLALAIHLEAMFQQWPGRLWNPVPGIDHRAEFLYALTSAGEAWFSSVQVKSRSCPKCGSKRYGSTMMGSGDYCTCQDCGHRWRTP